ncbi:transposase [Aquimarina algiphila]|nr:transposase [Aquimarina algiphila]
MFDFIAHIIGFKYFYNVEITPNNSLSNDQFLLQEAYDTLLKEHQKLQFDYQYLQQQLSELKRMIFGSKSERFVSSDTRQLDLFVEQLEVSDTKPESIEIAYKREKKTAEK